MISLLSTSQAQGFGRPVLVFLLNQVIQALRTHESAQNMAHAVNLATTNGRLPTLATQNNVYRYDLSDNTIWPHEDVWRVAKIHTREELTNDYEDYNITDYGSEYDKPVNTSQAVEINGNWYFPYYQCRSYDLELDGDGNSIGPIVEFSRNPGDTTDRYFIQAYKSVQIVSSDRQPIPLPDSDGAHLMIVFPCFTKLIEARNNGNYEEAFEYIKFKRIELYGILDKGAQGQTHTVTPRPY